MNAQVGAQYSALRYFYDIVLILRVSFVAS